MTTHELILATYREKGVRGTATALRMSPSTVTRIVHAHGITPPTGRPRTCKLDHDAFNMITPESAYWIGFLFADGCVADYGDGAPQIILDLAEKDRGHVEKFRTFLKSTHKIITVTHKKGTIPQRGKENSIIKERRSCAFRIRSKQIALDLLARGFSKKGPDRAPTPDLENSTDFWRGVVDGDGTVRVHTDPRRGYRFAHVILCGHLPLLESYIVFLQQKGVFANITNTTSGISQGRLMGAPAAIMIRALYENATVALDRKLKNACEALRLHSR